MCHDADSRTLKRILNFPVLDYALISQSQLTSPHPHHDTSHAILLIIPVNGKHIAILINAPLVYKGSDDNSISGGVGADLA